MGSFDVTIGGGGKSAGTVGQVQIAGAGNTFSVGAFPASIDQSTAVLHLPGGIDLPNNAGTAQLPFATRNTSGSEAVYDLTNVGGITVNNAQAAQMYIGPAPGDPVDYVGFWAGQSQSTATFANYQFLARSDGLVFFNSPTQLNFRIGNSQRLTFDNNSFDAAFAGGATFGGAVRPGSVNTATTPGTVAGQIVYDASAGANTGHFWGWDGSTWHKLDN